MKTCPTCHTQYTDDTLRFCLQDGAHLETVPVTQQPTVSLAGQEMETVARQAANEGRESVATQWKQQSQVTHVASLEPKRGGGSKLAIAAVAAAVVLFLLTGVGALGLWLYFSDTGPDIGGGNQNIRPPYNTNSNVTPTRTPLPSPTPTAAAPSANNSNSQGPVLMITPTPDVDRNQASREVSQQIYSWKSQAEAGDLNAYMRKYADSVDYYRKRGASADFVRSDKQRAFRLYSSMSINISNVNVSVGDSGDTATAVFDKEWNFSGASRSTGKVRQQMQFRKINGQWLITAERDLKVYYTN